MAGFLEGKNVAITGGGGGIGRATARACAAEGANVVVADFGVSLDGSDPSSEVADTVPGTVGTEKMPILDILEAMATSREVQQHASSS